MKIVTIGSAVYDHFIEYDHPQLMAFEVEGREQMYIILEEGRKLEIKKLEHATGGGALNSASCFKRVGFTVSPCAKLGNDSIAQEILNLLKQHKIDSSLLIQSNRVITGTSYVLPSPSGNNVVLVDRAANLTLSEKDLPIKKILQCDQLYITSLSGHTSKLLPIITKEAHRANVPVAANPGTSQLTVNVDTLVKSLPYIQILILNAFEASLLADKIVASPKNSLKMSSADLPDLLAAPMKGKKYFALRDYFKTVHEHGPQIVVVTNGEDGVYVSDGKKIYYHPSLPIDVLCTVGAGDAFGATFVSQLLKKKSIENAIRAGVINSAAVLEYLNATDGLLDQIELDELVSEIDPEGIKKFDL